MLMLRIVGRGEKTKRNKHDLSSQYFATQSPRYFLLSHPPRRYLNLLSTYEISMRRVFTMGDSILTWQS